MKGREQVELNPLHRYRRRPRQLSDARASRNKSLVGGGDDDRQRSTPSATSFPASSSL